MDSKKCIVQRQRHEVIYNHDPGAQGASRCRCARAASWPSWGHGAGKTTTLRAISNLPTQGEAERVTKGSIELRGERIENLSPADLVQARRGAGDGRTSLLLPT